MCLDGSLCLHFGCPQESDNMSKADLIIFPPNLCLIFCAPHFCNTASTSDSSSAFLTPLQSSSFSLDPTLNSHPFQYTLHIKLFFFFLPSTKSDGFIVVLNPLMTPSCLKVNTSTPQQGRQTLDNMALTYFAPSSSNAP